MVIMTVHNQGKTHLRYNNEEEIVEFEKPQVAGGIFYTPFPRISCKKILEPMEQTHSSCEG